MGRGEREEARGVVIWDASSERKAASASHLIEQRSSEVIRGHQRSSEVIRGHQRSSVTFLGLLSGTHRLIRLD